MPDETRDKPTEEDQIRKIVERWEAMTPAERGPLLVPVLGRAAVATVAYGCLAGATAVSAVRVWRRRDQGWALAFRRGGCWTVLACSAAALVLVRAAGRNWVTRNATARPGSDPVE